MRRTRQLPRTVGLALAGVGLAMTVFGVYRGEVEQVFTKGIQICLECIGIG